MKYKIILITLCAMTSVTSCAQLNTIESNDMIVSWEFQEDTIHFSMQAPTQGWVTIGFNETSNITGAYLLMGRVINGEAEVVEHYTLSPGNYKTLQELQQPKNVFAISGDEKLENTTLKFSVCTNPIGNYTKQLSQNKELHLILAFSREDDFQHHSIQRTSIKIKL